jgi:hypothetical protein
MRPGMHPEDRCSQEKNRLRLRDPKLNSPFAPEDVDVLRQMLEDAETVAPSRRCSRCEGRESD